MQESIGAFDPSLLSYLGTPQIETIKQVVANAFHLSVHNLESAQQGQHIVLARHIAMYLMRTLTDLSFPRIGLVFNRDHSTVMYGCGAVTCRMEREPAFAAMVQRLREKCCEGRTCD